jgi:reverse gyrase
MPGILMSVDEALHLLDGVDEESITRSYTARRLLNSAPSLKSLETKKSAHARRKREAELELRKQQESNNAARGLLNWSACAKSEHSSARRSSTVLDPEQVASAIFDALDLDGRALFLALNT